MQLVPGFRLPALQDTPPESLAMCQDAEDAESCCGSPTGSARGTDLWAHASSQQARWGSVQHARDHCSLPDSCHRHQQLDSFPCCHYSSDCGTTTGATGCTQGDDFEALEPSMLLDDPCFDTYPGGVEAALVDWRAAVSSKAQSPSPASATAEASSSCCNYVPHQHQQQQQQQQLMDPLAWERLLLGGWPADMCQHAAAAKQQLPELQQQQQHMCAVPPQQHPQQPGTAAAAAGAAKSQQQQALLQQRQQQQQWRGFPAFEGDVVGAVLAGVMPAPSCDSNDDLLEPLGFDLPCC